ncbi:SMP-30/gluconolactonase/LRE family protein [Ensifer sp. ENS06]|uniref:SMP-30/gluconolactonase/LRE family protein n=1 Tax=Ensifer sp. ENS06 TaxID=2769276 RepID=UPI0017818041|nr:SMP-30/gluconolactonase/LRE family protein [Ensifer sp. ENS06]MBD9628208.1 SMP-30/gluconolactonase/LRE family protein [Ensifer sp. ENS06]
MTKRLIELLGLSLDQLQASGIAQRVASGLRWGEGPAYVSELRLWLFSDIPNDRTMSYSKAAGTRVFRSPCNYANGHYPLKCGGFLSCEHLSRSVTRTDPAGEVSVVCDQYHGKRLNSPNDVVEALDGSIWFSDPTYGILSDLEGRRAEPEQSRNRVYRYDQRNGVLTAEVDTLSMPNGLCFSPNGTRLFVADSGAEMGTERGFDPNGPRDVFEFAVGADGHVFGKQRLFCHIEHGVPDGLRCDPEGRLWVATGRGVECYSDRGNLLGLIHSKAIASNLAFGGAGNDELLVTTESEAWLIRICQD